MLSKRLHTLASYHTTQTSIWDIGCDHGQLGLSFLDNSNVNSIHLVDPSELVIRTLKKKLIDSYITIPEKLIVQHEKGQDIKIVGEQNIIFIAGMGGKEIMEIVTSLVPQLSKSDQIIISPHKNILEMRKGLNQLALGLDDETLVFEEGRFYQILSLSKNPELPLVHEFGSKIWTRPDGTAYRDFMIKTFSNHQDQLSRRFVAFLQALSS